MGETLVLRVATIWKNVVQRNVMMAVSLVREIWS
jgi:hypothetical protein